MQSYINLADYMNGTNGKCNVIFLIGGFARKLQAVLIL